MPESGDVTAGQQVTAVQHNALRDDALRLWADAGAELTIAAGVITVAKETFYDVDTEADASSDSLVTINGGEAGEIIILRAANAARDVIVEHNTGNIHLQGGQDHILVNRDQLLILLNNGTDFVELAGGADRLLVFGANLGVGAGIIPSGTYLDVPFMPALYLLGIYAMAKQSGSVNIDIRTEVFGTIPDSADSIGTSPMFQMSSVQTKSETAFSGITREHASGRCWRFITTADSTTIEQVAIVCFGIKL